MTESNDAQSAKILAKNTPGCHAIAKPLWILVFAFLVLLAPWSITQCGRAITTFKELFRSATPVVPASPATLKTLTAIHDWGGGKTDSGKPTISWRWFPSGYVIQDENGNSVTVCFVQGSLRNQHPHAMLEADSVTLILVGPDNFKLFNQIYDLNRNRDILTKSDFRVKPHGFV